jgi:hypothetical protein
MNRVVLTAAVLIAAASAVETRATPTPFPSPSPGSTGPKPFLSKVEKIINPAPPSPTPTKFISQYASPTPTPKPTPSPASSASPSATPDIRFRPTKEGVDEPFYDVPWAVHIPIEIPFEGGAASVIWQARVSWENAPEEWTDQTNNLNRLSAGIYRLDGKRLEQNAIRHGNYAPSLDKNAPLPTYVWTPTSRNLFAGEKDKHKPLAGQEDDSLVVDPVLPGVYALWFALDSGYVWPQKDPKRDFLQGTIHFDCVVSRGADPLTTDQKEYLFGRGKRPDKMQDDKFYKVTTVDIPFKLRRDSWEFDHIEVIRTPDEKGEMLKKKRARYGDNYHKTYSIYTPKEKVTGTDAELDLTEKIQTNPRDGVTDQEVGDNDSAFDTVYIWDEKWKASFPPSLPDDSFGSVKFSGSREGKYQQKGLGTSASGTYPDWDPNLRWVMPPYYQSNAWIQEIRHPWEKSAQSGEKDAKDEMEKKYGKDALEWFVPDYFEDYRNAGVKAGEAPAQYVVRVNPPRVPDAAPLEVGAYPLIAFHVGPWEMAGFYKRKSEIENRVVASKAPSGDTTIVSDEDEFWKWYVSLVKLLEEQLPNATEAEIHAMQEGAPLQSLIKSRNHLLLSLQGDNAPAARGLQRVWNAKDSAWEWLDNNFEKYTQGTIPGGSEAGSVNTPVKSSPEMVQRIQKKVQELTADISQHRQSITEETKKAKDAYQKINAKLEEGNDKFGGPEHGELYVWRHHYKDIEEQLPIQIAVASNDPEMIKRALQDASKDGESADTFVLKAQLYKANGDPIAALEALRRAVTLDKKHALALQMKTDLECAFLQNAIDKSQGAIAQARNNFYGYLAERGFSDRDILAGATKPQDWLGTRIGVYGEEAWAILTTGIFGSFSGIYGKPAAEADLLATTENQMTTAFIGLHTMRLLRKRGATFEEGGPDEPPSIGKMKSFEIRDKLDMRGPNGQPISDADAANLAVAIREAMKLPDVQPLLTGDSNALRDGIQQGYWDPNDVTNTWIEYFGDITSAYNIFTLLLPAAKVGTAGRTMNALVWTQSEAQMMNELQALGKVTSGTEALATATGLTRKLNALGATDSGKKIVQYIKGLEKYQEGLGMFDKAIWTTGKITGALTFGFVTVSATEKLAGHKAAMLVAGALNFANDPDLLVKLLEARNIPPSAIAKVIISDYLPATQVHIKRLAATEATAGELRGLFERVKAGNKLAQADFDFLNKHFGSDWRVLIPGPNASENATIALLAAGEGAKNEVNNGAIKVLEELKPELTAEAEATQQTLEEEKKIADALNSAKTDPLTVHQPSTPERGPPEIEKPVTSKMTTAANGVPRFEPPPPPKKLRPPPPKPEYPPSELRVLPEEATAPEEVGGYPINPPMRETSRTAAAMQALNNGQYGLAERKFIEIQDLIRDGVVTEADEMTLERLHMFRMIANDLQRVTRKPPSAGLSAIHNPIPAAVVDQVLENQSLLKPLKTSGAMSDVFEVEGHPDLFVKRVRSKFQRFNSKLKAMEDVELDVLADVENNLVHEQLARAVGFEVPSMEVRIAYDAEGHAVEAYYVMRKVKGTPLSDMTVGEIYLYREELARHRALSVLIGDFDRKLDNYIITEDGRFVPIDAGMADVSGARLKGIFKEAPDKYRPDAPFSIDGLGGRDHWYSKSIVETPGEDLLTSPKILFRKFLGAEESLTFQGAEPTVIEIEKLFVNGSKAAEAEERIAVAYSKVYVPKGIKRLAELRGANLADPAVRAALEQEVMQNLRAVIKGKTEEVMNNLKARAPHIRDSMKGLNKRNGIPVYETDVSSVNPQFDREFVWQIALQHWIAMAASQRVTR